MLNVSPDSRGRGRRVGLLAVTAAAALALSLVEVGPAFAAGPTRPIVCQNGQPYSSWSHEESPWQVLHVLGIEEYGAPIVETVSLKTVSSVKASVVFTLGAQATFGFDLISSLGAELHLKLEKSGAETRTASVSTTVDITKEGTYLYFDGTHHAYGIVTKYICYHMTSWKTDGKAKVTSWTQMTTVGNVNCKAKPPKSSLAYVAKKDYCASA